MSINTDPAFLEGKLRERFANPLSDSVLCQFSTNNSFSPDTLSYKWVQVSDTRHADIAMPSVIRDATKYLEEGFLVPDLITAIKGHPNARAIKLIEDVRWGIEDQSKKIVMFEISQNGLPDVVIQNHPDFDAAIGVINRRLAAGTAAPAHWGVELANGIKLDPILFDARAIELQKRQVAFGTREHGFSHS